MGLITNVVDKFHIYSSIDTCAVWHLISSSKLYAMATVTGCEFVMSRYVEYECLHKPRAKYNSALRDRLINEKSANKFSTVNMSIDDLNEVTRLENRKKLGKGELSAIAIAKKLNFGLTTDDRKAFRLAQDELHDASKAQTIPQFLGWLLFSDLIGDSDVIDIIREHKSMGESHDTHFHDIYLEAMRCKLFKNNTN